MNPAQLIEARERLLKTAVDYFTRDPDVLGIFLGGSMAAGTVDAYSDIDLRVVVSPEEHPRFVRHRLEMPKAWGDFLFNEWLEGAQHCVSHFRPFGKIDVFYISLAEFRPPRGMACRRRCFTIPVAWSRTPSLNPKTLPSRSRKRKSIGR